MQSLSESTNNTKYSPFSKKKFISFDLFEEQVFFVYQSVSEQYIRRCIIILNTGLVCEFNHNKNNCHAIVATNMLAYNKRQTRITS